MRIQGNISNTGKLLAKLGDIQNVVYLAAGNEVALGGLEIQTDAKKSIAEHASVKDIVTRYNPKREHEVSEPGETPNSDLGKLAQSVETEYDSDTLTAVVGTNLEYGKFLELGTVKMEARPWLFPAFERNAQKIRDNITKALNDAIRGGKDVS